MGRPRIGISLALTVCRFGYSQSFSFSPRDLAAILALPLISLAGPAHAQPTQLYTPPPIAPEADPKLPCATDAQRSALAEIRRQWKERYDKFVADDKATDAAIDAHYAALEKYFYTEHPEVKKAYQALSAAQKALREDLSAIDKLFRRYHELIKQAETQCSQKGADTIVEQPSLPPMESPNRAPAKPKTDISDVLRPPQKTNEQPHEWVEQPTLPKMEVLPQTVPKADTASQPAKNADSAKEAKATQTNARGHWIDTKTGKTVASGPIVGQVDDGSGHYVQRAVLPDAGDPNRAFDPGTGRNFARDSNGHWIDTKTGKAVASGPIAGQVNDGSGHYVQRAVLPNAGDPHRAYDPETGRNFAWQADAVKPPTQAKTKTTHPKKAKKRARARTKTTTRRTATKKRNGSDDAQAGGVHLDIMIGGVGGHGRRREHSDRERSGREREHGGDHERRGGSLLGGFGIGIGR
jgi:hypothetical protein